MCTPGYNRAPWKFLSICRILTCIWQDISSVLTFVQSRVNCFRLKGPPPLTLAILPQSRAEQSKIFNKVVLLSEKYHTTTPPQHTNKSHSLNYLELFNTIQYYVNHIVRHCTTYHWIPDVILSHFYVRQSSVCKVQKMFKCSYQPKPVISIFLLFGGH